MWHCFFFFVVLNFCCVVGDLVQRESENPLLEWRSYQDRGKDDFDERIRRLDEKFGFTGPTANDAPDNLIRPCALNDWQCIRKFFASNGKCVPAYGPIPDPLILEVNTIFLPCVNLSITFIDYEIRGLSSVKVTEFYVNKKSGNLVLALDINDFNMTSPRAYFRFQRTAKESIVTADTSTALFRSITLTIIIPKVPNLRLDKSETHFFVDDGMPDFKFGPKALSADPDVVDAYAQLAGPLRPVGVRESFLLQTKLFAGAFIQKAICDFGVKYSTS